MNEWQFGAVNGSFSIFTNGTSTAVYPSGTYRYAPTYREAADNGGWAAEYQREVARQLAEALATDRRMQAERAQAAPSKSDLDPQKEEGPMETLFQVLIVTKARKIIDAGFVVAPDESTADFEADVAGKLRAEGLKPRDVTVIRIKHGQVAVEKEPQKMRLVKDDEAAPTA